MNNNEIGVYYPNWIKALGIVGIPLMALTAVWMILQPLWEPELTNAQQILFPVIGIAVIYQCYIGSKCLAYLNTMFILHDNGVDVLKKGSSIEYSWDELAVKEYSFASTTQITNQDGKTIAYFSDGLPNLKLLVNTINNGIS